MQAPSTTSPITPASRQKQYIAMLQERNRLKKEVATKSKSAADKSNEARERGFNLQVSGANGEKKSLKPSGSQASVQQGSIQQASIQQASIQPSPRQQSPMPYLTNPFTSSDSPLSPIPLNGVSRRKQWNKKASPLEIKGAMKPSFAVQTQAKQPGAAQSGAVQTLGDTSITDLDETQLYEDDFDEFEGTLTGSINNNTNPPPPRVSKATFDQTPMRRPSSARARALLADRVTQSLDFVQARPAASKASAASAADQKSAFVTPTKGKATRNNVGDTLDASVTGSLFGQIKNLTPEQQRKLLSRLQGMEEETPVQPAEPTTQDQAPQDQAPSTPDTPVRGNKILGGFASNVRSPSPPATPEPPSVPVIDAGFGLSSCDSTPTKSTHRQSVNDMLEQSFESLSNFNTLGRKTHTLGAVSSPDAVSAHKAGTASGSPEKMSPNQENRKQQSKTIMERIKEAEQQIELAGKFSSDEEEEDDDEFACMRMYTQTEEDSTAAATTATGIPTLPTGRHLQFTILSTWGDPYYVGCAGIELFDACGDVIGRVGSVSAVDVNCLAGARNDPRTSEKLFDGMCHTCDDLHAWLAPWGEQESVTIDVDLKTDNVDAQTLSMLRIWNYNKSREQSFRGMRMVKITLDGGVIFEGEIRRAAGSLKGPDECSDAVLFTTAEDVVNKIERRDETSFPEFRGGVRDVSDTLVQRIKREFERSRPRTAEELGESSIAVPDFTEERPATRAGSRPLLDRNGGDEGGDEGGDCDLENELAKMDSDEEEEVICTQEKLPEEDSDDFDVDGMLAEFSPKAKGKAKAVSPSAKSSGVNPAAVNVFACDGVTLKILATHEGGLLQDNGSLSKYIGLGGLRLIRYDQEGDRFFKEDLKSSGAQLDASPRDLKSLGYEGDNRVLGNLFEFGSKAISTDDYDMWLVPDSVTAGVGGADGSVEIRVKFGSRIEDLYGVEVYNYNKVGVGENGEVDGDVFDEDTLRGARVMSVSLKGYEGSSAWNCGAFNVRRAPSCASFDYKQVLVLGKPHAMEAADLMEKGGRKLNFKKCQYLRQDYETPFLPAGQLVKMVIHSSWGDPYYVGLDAFEILSVEGRAVKIDGVGGCPRNVDGDHRVPENLVARAGAAGSWLAPLAASLGDEMKASFAPGHYGENVLFFCMDDITHIAGIRLSNYKKNAMRGVRDFSLWVDGQIVYRGFMDRGDRAGAKGHAILFCGEKVVCDALGVGGKADLFYCGAETQDVECIDEMVVRERSKFSSLPADPSAYGVKADLGRRPSTGQRRQHGVN